MADQLYKNNATALLRAALPANNSNASVLVAIGKAVLFPASVAGVSYFIATLSSPSLPGVTEIVKCIYADYAGDALTCERAQEGTTGQAWGLDARIEMRLTAGTLERMASAGLQNASAHAQGLAVGLNANSVSAAALGFQASTAVAAGQILRVADMVCAVLVAGTTGATAPDPLVNTYSSAFSLYVFTSGTATLTGLYNFAATFGTTALGANSHAVESGVAVGQNASATGANSVAVGKSAFALSGQAAAVGFSAVAHDSGVAVGHNTLAEVQAVAVGSTARAAVQAVAIGRVAKASGPLSVAIGDAAHTEREYQVAFAGHLMLGRDDWTAGAGSHKNSGAESAWASHYAELGVPAPWAGSTTYTDGAVVSPTVANGKQYRLWHGAYNAAAVPNTATSHSVQPTWPAAIGDSVEADNPAVGNHYWIAADLAAGMDETIPPGMVFYPTEIGFICFGYSGVTAAPFVSIGTVAAPTLLVNNQQLSGITGASQRHVFTGFKDGISNLRIKLITPATGASARFHGRFYAKGFFIQTQG